MEHPIHRPVYAFVHQDDFQGMLAEQQMGDAYPYAWSQSFDPYAAPVFEHEAMPSMQLDAASQFCSPYAPSHADDRFYPATGQHCEALLSSNTAAVEQRMIFPTDNWSTLCLHDRMGSPVDTVSSSKSSPSFSTLPQSVPAAGLTPQHYTPSNFPHVNVSSVFFQEPEPLAILPTQFIVAELDTPVNIVESDTEVETVVAAAPLAELAEVSIDKEASSDESEATWRQKDKSSDVDSEYTPGSTSGARKRSQRGRSRGQPADRVRSKVVKRAPARQPQRGAPAGKVNAASPAESEYERRTFTCPGRPYGCQTTFTSKNEWKRHVISQHLCLGYWRCDQCPMGKDKCPNDFNRKDLFTQHLRRMHAPANTTSVVSPASSKSGPRRTKGRAKPTAADEAFALEIERIRERCWIQARQPPSHLECAFCKQVFHGDAACLEDFLEHVGRHLAAVPGEERTQGDDEQKHNANSAIFLRDEHMRQWLVRNGLLRRSAGSWELCSPATATLPSAASLSWGAADAEGDSE